MKKVIILLILFAISISVAQDGGLQKARKLAGGTETFVDIPTELQDNIAKFFNRIGKKEIKDAYENLLEKSPIFEKKEELSSLVKQTLVSFDFYGKFYGFEPVNAEKVTDSYMRIRYIGLYEKYPIRWVFTYYKSPSRGWIVTNVKFDDLSEFFFYDE